MVFFSLHAAALELLSNLRWINSIKTNFFVLSTFCFRTFETKPFVVFLSVTKGPPVVLRNLTFQLFINYKYFLWMNNASLNCLLNFLWHFTTGKWYKNALKVSLHDVANRPENIQCFVSWNSRKNSVFLVFWRLTPWRSHLLTSDVWVQANCQTKIL